MTGINEHVERVLRPRNRTWLSCGRCHTTTRHHHIGWEYDDEDAPPGYGEPWNDRGQAIWECTRCLAGRFGPYPWTV